MMDNNDDNNRSDTQPLDTICTCNTCDHNNTSDCVGTACCLEVCSAMSGS